MAAGRDLDNEPEPNPPRFPEVLRYVWEAYGDLHRRHKASGFGASPISYPEIESYMRISARGSLLSLFDVDILAALDDTRLEASAEESGS